MTTDKASDGQLIHNVIDPDKFWAKVEIRGPGECWPWTKRIAPNGYGHYAVNLGNYKTKNFLAHRVAFQLANNCCALRRYMVCHHCDNKPCCNPSCLFLGTGRDNQLDCVAKGRKNYQHGQSGPNSVITDGEATDIRWRYLALPGGYCKLRHAVKQLSEEFGLPDSIIERVITGRAYHRGELLWPKNT